MTHCTFTKNQDIVQAQCSVLIFNNSKFLCVDWMLPVDSIDFLFGVCWFGLISVTGVRYGAALCSVSFAVFSLSYETKQKSTPINRSNQLTRIHFTKEKSDVAEGEHLV